MNATSVEDIGPLGRDLEKQTELTTGCNPFSQESAQGAELETENQPYKNEDHNGNVSIPSESKEQADLDNCRPAELSYPEEKSAFKKAQDSDMELGDTSNLDAEGRNKLFARGLSLEKGGKKELALKCYLGCLSGLSKDTRFVLLPQCLRNIAEIYYENQEFEKAIHFIQAEKLYYENALINTEEIKKKLEEMQLNQESGDHDTLHDKTTLETIQAEEYEHLAKLCIDHKQPQLALEYAGKCTKLRQEVLGNHHPKTLESLDFFAALYAEVGKQQYTDSLETASSPGEGVPESEDSVPSTPTNENSPVSILRNRKNSEKEKKQVRFHESVVDNTNREQEECLSRTLLSVLLFICCFFLSVLGLGLYCRLVETGLCHTLTDTLYDAYLQVRYHYYKYTSTKHVKFA